jgi:hypothetical protein
VSTRVGTAGRDSDSRAEANVWVRAVVESRVDEVLWEIGDEKAATEADFEREEGGGGGVREDVRDKREPFLGK